MRTGFLEVCLVVVVATCSWECSIAVPEKIVCYYTNWAQYRRGIGHYTPDNIPPGLCTHIIYAFAKVARDPRTKAYTQIKIFEWNDLAMYKKVTAMKSSGTSVLLAVGGWTHGTWLFKQMANKESTRKSFIKNTIAFLRKHNFDGLDYDWEFPDEASKEHFAALMRETRQAFEEEGKSRKIRRLLLSAAIAPWKSRIDSGYDIPELVKNLDFINVMSYDLHSYREISHHSPLNKQNETIQHLQTLGAPASKLILGIATYGRTYTMLNASSHTVGAPATGAGKPGIHTRQGGILAYYEVCAYRQASDWQEDIIPVQQVPYGWKGNQWVGFDDITSVRRKAEYSCTEQLGGVMFWTMDLDDFTGNSCGGGKYPLIRSARDVLSQRDCSGDTNTNDKLSATFS